MINNKTFSIYKATFKNGKSYIGQTSSTFLHRKNNHIWHSKNESNFSFYKAMRKYGLDNIEWSILEICHSKEEANFLENYYIKYYGSFRHDNGYNGTLGGDGYLCNHTQETKDKISKKQKASKIGDRAKLNLQAYYNAQPEKRSEIQLELMKNPARKLKAQESAKNMRTKAKAAGKSMGRPKVSVVLVKDLLILEFNSIKEAAIYLDIDHSAVSAALYGRSKTVRNFKVYSNN